LIKTFLELEKFSFELEEKNENDKNKIHNLSLIEQKFLNNFNIIKEYFIELKQFNNHFFKNFTKKIKNLKLYQKKIENSNLIIDLNELEKSNFNIEINEQNEIIIDIYKAKELLKEINGTSWYQCPNGHVYAIGDCGNPWENAKCPECNESIGGTLHQLNEGNVRLGININNNDSDDEINSDEIDESSDCTFRVGQQRNANLNCKLNIKEYQDIKTLSFKTTKIEYNNEYNISFLNLDQVYLISEPESEDGSNGKKIGLIIGIVVGGVVVIAISTVIIYFCIRRKKLEGNNESVKNFQPSS
jgi:hypothetical protein